MARYRLDVVAPSILGAVRFAGGWLFDRVMAGWDVTVLLAEGDDDRPLQILGADTADLETALTSRMRGPRPDAIAVAAGLYGSDPRVRESVRRAQAAGTTEVRLWGEHWPAGQNCVGAMEHRLSFAARAFKAQALAAVSEPIDQLVLTEMFRRPLD